MLPTALEPLAQYAQFVLFRKSDKTPCDYRTGAVCDAQNPINQTDVVTAYAAAKSRQGYGVGFVLRATDPFVVFDADNALLPDNTWSAESLRLVESLPGAAVEVSISGRGLHIWATSANVPSHACKNLSAHFEMYHEGRYIALGEYPGTTGNAATDCTTALPAIISKWFPPSAPAASQGLTGATDPEWRGPADDTELLHRMLASKPSIGAAFGGRATIAELWNRDVDALARAFPASGDAPYDASSADAALAAHLAWWTGKNAERIERLMRQSGLMRDKYDRADYLPRTIAAAIGMTRGCYQERQADDAATPQRRFNLLSSTEIAALPPLKWRVKGVLPETGLAAVFGASGSGKSFLVLDALQSVAAGADWFCHRVTPCPVVYCALEGEGGIAGRAAAYRIRHGSTAENIRYLVQPFSLLDGGDIHDLASAIKANGNGAGVVVLDTLNRAAPGADENDSKAMGQIIAAGKELQTLIGGLVLLVHHTGKDASKGLRGHSSLHAALDAAIEVRRDGDRREWLIAKSKDGEDGAAHPFRLDVVELGIDEDGEAVTSCVVHPVEETGDSIRRALPPKSGNQRAVWDALGEIFRKVGTNRPAGAPDALPLGRPCIGMEDAIEQTRSKLICEAKRQTERTQAAIRGLVDRGLLQHEAGFIWIK